MTTAPRRLEKRQPHLGAHIVPVERALLARAKALEQIAASEAVLTADPAEAAIAARVATEFRALADEFHWWA